MLINENTLSTLNAALKLSFQNGVKSIDPIYINLATTVGSSSTYNLYSWIGEFPSLREWVGERVIKNMTAYSYTLANKKYESTISVKRDHVADDQFGLYKSIFEEIGAGAAIHPHALLFELLKDGFTNKCYDGKPFFSELHPIADGVYSNIQVPTNKSDYKPAWYLFDTSRAIKPFIYQEREKYEMNRVDNENDYNVFMREEYLYGVRGRCNVGYGFWQQAFVSRKELTSGNFSELYSRMVNQKSEEKRPLRIKPTILLVGESNREAAFFVAQADKLKDNTPNPNKGLVNVIVSPFID